MFPLIISLLATSSYVIALVTQTQRRGRPSSYSTAQPPTGGWKSSSVNSEHGKLLIGLINRGEVSQSDPPLTIWKNHEFLRVVNPKKDGGNQFKNFVQKCKVKAKKNLQDQGSDEDEMPREAKGRSDWSSDFESDDDESYITRGTHARMPPPTDAPSHSGNDALFRHPLQTKDALRTRDQRISPPVRVYDTSTGNILAVGMLAGQDITSIDATRHPKQKDVVILEMNSPFVDEDQLKSIFCSGTCYGVGEHDQLLRVSPNDNTLAGMMKQTVKINGGSGDDRGQVAPKAFMAVRMNRNVKERVSAFNVVDQTGVTVAIQGMFQVGAIAYFNFEGQDVDSKVRNRVSKASTTPPRSAYNVPLQPQAGQQPFPAAFGVGVG